MLVIVENWNIAALFKLSLNLKATWGGYIFEVHHGEATCRDLVKAYGQVLRKK